MLFQNFSKLDMDKNNSKIGGAFQTKPKILLYLFPGQAIFKYSRHFHNSWSCRKSVVNTDHNLSNGILNLLSTLAVSQLSDNATGMGVGQNDLDTCRETITFPRHSAWDYHSETYHKECHSSELRREHLG